MQYDFDMFSVMPDEVRAQFQGMFNELGVNAMMGRQVALWRDPAVVAALRSADEPVRRLFLDAGFGLNVYHSGAPSGRYPARDEAARNGCIQRLGEAIEASEGLKAANWGGFDIGAFLEHLIAATPMDEIDIAAHVAALNREAHRRKRARLGLRFGLALLAIPAVAYAVGAVV